MSEKSYTGPHNLKDAFGRFGAYIEARDRSQILEIDPAFDEIRASINKEFGLTNEAMPGYG